MVERSSPSLGFNPREGILATDFGFKSHWGPLTNTQFGRAGGDFQDSGLAVLLLFAGCRANGVSIQLDGFCVVEEFGKAP